MLKKISLFIITFTCSTTALAKSQDVQQGTNQYDWRTCISEKQNECFTDCANSEDVSCSDDCDQLAADKCKSRGLTPPH